MSFPDFLIIGAPKCGTTFLHSLLNQHPQVFMPMLKEPHYFSWIGDARPRWAATKDLDAYKELFEHSLQGRVLTGEASTWYLYSPRAAAEIQRQVPNVRLIAILRDPVQRAYSSYQFRRSMGYESLSFIEAISKEPSRISEGAEWDFHYLNAGKYANQLERYLQFFPRTQLLVLRFEDLTTNPNHSFHQCCKFLGMATKRLDRKQMTPQNVTERRAAFQMPLFRRLTSKLTPSAVKTIIRNLPTIRKSRHPPKLARSIEREIRKGFIGEIERLEHILGTDLSEWKRID